jgi:hypothetical protein
MSSGSDPELEAAIRQRAIDGIQRVAEGDEDLQYMTIADQMKAIQYAKGATIKKPPFGMYRAKQISPGTG